MRSHKGRNMRGIQGRQPPWHSLRVCGNKGQGRLGYTGDRPVKPHPLCEYFDIDSNRCRALSLYPRIKAEQISNEYRLTERERIYCNGHNPAVGALTGRDGSRYIHLRHDPASEHVAMHVRAIWLRNNAQYRYFVFGKRYGSHVISIFKSRTYAHVFFQTTVSQV